MPRDEPESVLSVRGKATLGGQAGPEVTVLACEGVGVDYRLRRGKDLQAIKDITFELHGREILGVVGQSGSGKSTLGKVVAGFLPPSAGTLRVLNSQGDLEGRIVRRGRGFRDIQMIFQESASALDPRLPAWKSVAEPWLARWTEGFRVSQPSARPRALEQLSRVGLSAQYAGRRPHELSGGQKQRVAIARALGAEPNVMVCDEALSSLDVTTRARVINLFERIRNELGVAMIFISHDISVIAHLADRVLILQHGRIVESGPVREIIDKPQHEYTRQLIDAVPTLESAIS